MGALRVRPRRFQTAVVALAAGAAVLGAAASCNLNLTPYTDPTDAAALLGDGLPDGGGDVLEAGAPDDAGTKDGAPATDAGGKKRVFVTSTVTGGDTGGLVGADSLCQKRADAVHLGSRWVAFVSGKNANAPDRILGDGPWYLVDNVTRVFASHAALLKSSPEAAIDHDETGAVVTSARDLVWTGTSTMGTMSENCGDFTTILGAIGVAGLASSRASDWIQSEIADCSTGLHLYCFEQ
jgi:hypothetical protein